MKIIDITKKENIREAIESAVNSLKNGEIFIYPTDTIYGIGCDSDNKAALEKIFKVKRRCEAKQFIILVNSLEMTERIVFINKSAEEMMHKYWPGPLTLILNSRYKMEFAVSGEENKIAVRMPDNDFCLKLIEEYNKPVVSTSANIHMQEQGDFNSIVKTFGDDINLFIYNGEVESGLPSTIIDVTSEERKIIREGVLKI
jgi:L-threonylcarbamoyladenylate synthase